MIVETKNDTKNRTEALTSCTKFMWIWRNWRILRGLTDANGSEWRSRTGLDAGSRYRCWGARTAKSSSKSRKAGFDLRSTVMQLAKLVLLFSGWTVNEWMLILIDVVARNFPVVISESFRKIIIAEYRKRIFPLTPRPRSPSRRATACVKTH